MIDDWKKLGYDSADDYIRDRFYDERDEPELPEFYGQCGSCYEFVRCLIDGHTDIGFCQDAQEFCRVDDEVECESYWERM